MTIFDDFNDGDISEYSGDTSNVSVVTSPTLEGSHALQGSGETSTITSTTGLNAYPSTGDQFSMYVRTDRTPDGTDKQIIGLQFGVQSETGESSFSGYLINFRWDSGELTIYSASNGSYTVLSNDKSGSASDYNADQWYELAVTQWDSNGNISVELREQDGTVLLSTSTTDTTYSSGGLGIRCDHTVSGNEYVDFYATTDKNPFGTTVTASKASLSISSLTASTLNVQLTGNLTVEGTAQSGASVVAYNVTDGRFEGRDTTDASGNWSINLGGRGVIEVGYFYDDGSTYYADGETTDVRD